MKNVLRPKNTRMWSATTGFSKEKFLRLLPLFSAAYEAEFGRPLQERIADSLKEVTFSTPEALLLFTLFSLKSGLTYDALGFVYEIDGSNAKRNQLLGMRVLKRTLQEAQLLPARELSEPEELYAHFQKEAVILLDGTEQRMQRPGDQQEQKAWYSGKKKRTP